MAKVSPKSKLHRIVKNISFSIIGLVVLGGLAYVVVIRPIQIKNDKNNFLKAQSSIEDLYSKIVAKIGKPDQVKKEQSCAYANRAYGKGPRSCAVGIFFLYEKRDLRHVNLLLAKSTQSVGQDVYPGPGEKYQNAFISLKKNGDQNFSQDLMSVNTISCTANYSFPVYPSFFTSLFKPQSNSNFMISLTCGGSSKSEHFPVKT
ncbi:MAG TPA: hypothetical protein VJJ78_03080 [Candidatus Saccharimonadales bacterium]|nr:hypothetical protein [Candidatus Saccharimonadales bacterium]